MAKAPNSASAGTAKAAPIHLRRLVAERAGRNVRTVVDVIYRSSCGVRTEPVSVAGGEAGGDRPRTPAGEGSVGQRLVDGLGRLLQRRVGRLAVEHRVLDGRLHRVLHLVPVVADLVEAALGVSLLPHREERHLLGGR